VSKPILHELVEPWWTTCDPHPLQRGQLIQAFVPHVGLTPYVLHPEGRSSATDHTRALFTVKPLRIRDDRRRGSQLPVAALPMRAGEVWAAYRAKVRWCLVVSVGGTDVDKSLRPSSSPKWQSAPTILVAPYYGAPQSGDRAGWHGPFLERIRACEYPQFLIDSLPLRGKRIESVLRLDHLQPIGRHHDSFTPTEHRLSEDAMDMVDEWLEWLRTGVLAKGATLHAVRSIAQESGAT